MLFEKQSISARWTKLNALPRIEQRLEYKFIRTDDDAGLSSDLESEGDEADEIDDSNCITLENIPGFQLTLTQDKDDKESFGLAAKEQKRKISEAIVITTFEEYRDNEMEKICKCYMRKRRILHLGHSLYLQIFSRCNLQNGFFSSRKGVAGHENHRTS
ncbi:hypothetical protein CRENBAI_010397 [Crenichthys baileyi]|uniref:Uncharacterized protein n=1 Tax=Crenichthys baileyi TaxID=28760 RepID=A0AAV9QVA9_9TELE